MKYKPVVLIVDDETEILKVLRKSLNAEYEVLTASRAKEALELLEESVEIVLSDQRMPEMNGSDFLKIVREKFPNTVRIMMSGYSDVDALIRSVNEGELFRYINKPWDLPTLFQTLALARKKYQHNISNENLTEEKKRLTERDRDLSYQLARALADLEDAKAEIENLREKK